MMFYQEVYSNTLRKILKHTDLNGFAKRFWKHKMVHSNSLQNGFSMLNVWFFWYCVFNISFLLLLNTMIVGTILFTAA